MATYWCPADGHPDGPSDAAWFRVVAGWGFRTERHPAGASASPCFRVVDGMAFPTFSLPRTVTPTFQVVGSFAYHDVDGSPWFHIIVEIDDETAPPDSD